MTEKEYEYILNPKTGKLVKTCGNIGMKLIKNYEYDEIYNPETKRTVNFNKTTGKKVYKKYGKYIEKYSKKGGSLAAAITCPTTITLRKCKKSESSPTCSVHTLKRDPQQKNNSCRFILPKTNYMATSSSGKKSNYGRTSNSALLNLASDFGEKLNENSYFAMYSYDNISYIVSSTLNSKNVVKVEQYDYFQNPPNPPNPPKSTSTYQFDCEPSNAKKANAKQNCNSSFMQENETLKYIFQILAAYIDTIVMLLYPQLTNIFTVNWLKNVVIEYIFNEILNLVIPDETNKKSHLVNILVRNMMGDNVITISAKLTLKEFASGYTTNLPQVIIKKEVITLLDYVQKLKSETSQNLEREYELNNISVNTELNTEVKTKLNEIVGSVNFGITVTNETHSQ